MDCEPEELQFLGFIGIFREASKILASWRRLFAQIAGALIFPLSLLFFLHIVISHHFFVTIDADDNAIDSSPPGSAAQSSALRDLTAEWSAFLVYKAVYLVALLVLALLSTSAVVYTVASIYTAKELSLRKVLAVVPKVWRRLLVTFLWAFLILVAYHSAFVVLIIAVLLILGGGGSGSFLILFILLVIYLVGLVWISVVWHLASVVSVLEDVRGLDAMRKSRVLIKGKLGVASAIFVVLNLCFIGAELGLRMLVVEGHGGGGAAVRLLLGAVLLGLLCAVILLALVAQTVVYFVCKSYHHESIDKSNLADHLEVYLGEYVPLKARDVQMEQLSI